MNLHLSTTVVFIALGACVLVAALASTRRVLPLIESSRFRRTWKALVALMVGLLCGYLVSLGLALSGHLVFVNLLTGVTFILGAAFVHFTVHVGRRTIEELVDSTVSKVHFARTIETMADALIVLDADLTIRTVNQAATELAGCSREDLLGRPAAEVFTDCDLFGDPEPLLRSKSRGAIEKTCRTTDGHKRTVAFSWSPLRGADGRPDGVVCLVQDLTERIRAERALQQTEQRLLHRATHDDMTGLPNRALLADRIDRVVELARRDPDYRFAVVSVDIDRFRTINDSLGHDAGDQLVREVAGVLQGCLRVTDTVGRPGGDEFLILVEDIKDTSDALRVIERIDEDLAGPLEVAGQELHVTLSLGVVLSETGYESTADVLRDATIAMNRAKAAGGNRYEIFDAQMRERMVVRLGLESELRRAAERGELEAHYQPIVDLDNGEIAGLEALVRWNHPTRGRVPPLEFIPLAEETGLVVDIDRWMLREACRQTRAWQQEFPALAALTISVNLSSIQFVRPDLVAHVSGVLEETGLAPECLKLEITETAFADNLETISATLLALRERGVQIEIDDFGTGYSSLSYLHRLPIDMLKIDRSFIHNMTAGGTDLAIVHTIMMLVQALEIRAVAEGVETDEQRQRLRDLRCDYAQGYLFSKPLPASAIRDRLARAALTHPGMPTDRDLERPPATGARR